MKVLKQKRQKDESRPGDEDRRGFISYSKKEMGLVISFLTLYSTLTGTRAGTQSAPPKVYVPRPPGTPSITETGPWSPPSRSDCVNVVPLPAPQRSFLPVPITSKCIVYRAGRRRRSRLGLTDTLVQRPSVGRSFLIRSSLKLSSMDSHSVRHSQSRHFGNKLNVSTYA